MLTFCCIKNQDLIGVGAGGVAHWLTGGLSLIYAWSVVDVWPLCG